ncbi:hypothetical protein C8J57DRAFT_1458880 [Mycena rebaudengoi]|nr:hypothetical protein C8J57DRAFT_1458880 [Mycena rebaudengoi]
MTLWPTLTLSLWRTLWRTLWLVEVMVLLLVGALLLVGGADEAEAEFEAELELDAELESAGQALTVNCQRSVLTYAAKIMSIRQGGLCAGYSGGTTEEVEWPCGVKRNEQGGSLRSDSHVRSADMTGAGCLVEIGFCLKSVRNSGMNERSCRLV